MTTPGPRGEVLLEFVAIGNSVKVTAVDPATGTEVSIVGPAGGSRLLLEKAAIRKLDYVLAKKRKDGRQGPSF